MARPRRRPRTLAVHHAVLLGLFLLVTALGRDWTEAADGPPKLRGLIDRGLNNHDGRSTTPVIKKTPQDGPRVGAVDVSEATFAAVARYRYGDDRKPLAALRQLVVDASSLGSDDARGFRGRLAERMASLLASGAATWTPGAGNAQWSRSLWCGYVGGGVVAQEKTIYLTCTAGQTLTASIQAYKTGASGAWSLNYPSLSIQPLRFV